MKKIVIGGHMSKREIKKDLQKYLTVDDDVEIIIKSDLEAALLMKNDDSNYYIGACMTGAGGALAIVMALLGSSKVVTISSPSKIMTEEEIRKSIDDGKVAFGFAINTKNIILPILARNLFKQDSLGK